MTRARPRTAPPVAIAAVLALLLAVGGVLAWYKAPFVFGVGDPALFHAFGRWLLGGEVYIRDFIHFRTPGPYYYYAVMQGLLGSEFRSTALAIVLEAHVAQTAAGFLLGLAATRAVWGRASLAVATVCGAAFLVLPPIFQLRTALPALALAAYVMAQAATAPAAERRWLAVAGALLGLTYWFGQELFIFLAWTLFCIEVLLCRDRPAAAVMRRLLVLTAAGLAVILPPLALLAAAGMDVGEYLYYTLTYAFFIQPGGMDLPYPPLRWDTLVFYVVFAELAAAAAVFALAGRLGHPVVAAVLAFASIRMISALGRSDFLHLLFSVGEAVVVLPLALLMLRETRLAGRWPLALAAGGGLALVFAGGVLVSGKVLLLAPPLVALCGRLGERAGQAPRPAAPLPRPAGFLAAAAASAVLIVAAFHPHTLRTAQFGIRVVGLTPTDPLLGVQLPPLVRAEIAAIAAHAERLGADSLFSFPLRSDLYALVPHHPTRLTYFEPQTTAEEFAGVFADLEAAPPPLVVNDLMQTALMSHMIHPVADFIGSRYQVTATVRGASVLEVLTPRPQPVAQRRLFDRLNLANPEREAVVAFAFVAPAADRPEEPVLAVRRTARFPFEPGPERALVLALDPAPAGAASAEVTLTRGAVTEAHRLEAGTGPAMLPLPAGDGPLVVELHPGDDGRPALWRNPVITADAAAGRTTAQR